LVADCQKESLHGRRRLNQSLKLVIIKVDSAVHHRILMDSSTNDANPGRRPRLSFSSKVKGKLRSLSRSRPEKHEPLFMPSGGDSETSTLVNFVIDRDNQNSYILEEQESQTEADVHPSSSSHSFEHASPASVRSQESFNDMLDQDNTSWASRKPKRVKKKAVNSGRTAVSSSVNPSEEDQPTDTDCQDVDNLSTSAEQRSTMERSLHPRPSRS